MASPPSPTTRRFEATKTLRDTYSETGAYGVRHLFVTCGFSIGWCPETEHSELLTLAAWREEGYALREFLRYGGAWPWVPFGAPGKANKFRLQTIPPGRTINVFTASEDHGMQHGFHKLTLRLD